MALAEDAAHELPMVQRTGPPCCCRPDVPNLGGEWHWDLKEASKEASNKEASKNTQFRGCPQQRHSLEEASNSLEEASNKNMFRGGLHKKSRGDLQQRHNKAQF